MYIFRDTSNRYRVRLNTRDFNQLDPLKDFQFVRVENMQVIPRGAILWLSVHESRATKPGCCTLKTFWIHGDTIEVTLYPKKLRLPEGGERYVGYQDGDLYKIIIQDKG